MKLEEVGQVNVDGRGINVDKISKIDKLDDLMKKIVKEEDNIIARINKLAN